MNPDEYTRWPLTPLYRNIPVDFYSLELDGPFEKCTMCEASLLADPDLEYCIERIFRGMEPIIEYAICIPCHQSVCEELSAESMQRIQELFTNRVDYQGRIDRLAMHLNDESIDAWIGECLVNRKPRELCRGHQILGRFRGDQIIVDFSPVMLCEEFIEEMQQSLSKKTRERLGDFVSTNFGMPPEFCEDPSFTPVLI